MNVNVLPVLMDVPIMLEDSLVVVHKVIVQWEEGKYATLLFIILTFACSYYPWCCYNRNPACVCVYMRACVCVRLCAFMCVLRVFIRSLTLASVFRYAEIYTYGTELNVLAK